MWLGFWIGGWCGKCSGSGFPCTLDKKQGFKPLAQGFPDTCLQFAAHAQVDEDCEGSGKSCSLFDPKVGDPHIHDNFTAGSGNESDKYTTASKCTFNAKVGHPNRHCHLKAGPIIIESLKTQPHLNLPMVRDEIIVAASLSHLLGISHVPCYAQCPLSEISLCFRLLKRTLLENKWVQPHSEIFPGSVVGPGKGR